MDQLPAADPDLRLATTAVDASGVRHSLEIADSIRVAAHALPLDDDLRATLAWSRPGRRHLLVELASVVGATERSELTLRAPAADVGALADAPLVELQADDPYDVDGATLLAVLARVRGVVESSARFAGWHPVGAFERVLPLVASDPLERVSEITLAERGLALAEPRNPGATVALISDAAGPIGISTWLKLGAFVLLIPLVLGAAGLSIWGVLGGQVAALALGLLVVLLPLRARALRVPQLELGPDLAWVGFGDGDAPFARADLAIALADRIMIVLVPRDPERPCGLGMVPIQWHMQAAPFVETLVELWDLAWPRLRDVETRPAWLTRSSAALHEPGWEEATVAGDALWFDDAIGVAPGRFFSVDNRKWQVGRYFARATEDRVELVAAGDPLAPTSDPELVARTLNELAGVFPPSVFIDRTWTCWTVHPPEVRPANDRFRIVSPDGGAEIVLQVFAATFAGERVAASEIVAIAVAGTTVVVKRRRGASLEVACPSAASAGELRELLATWHDPASAQLERFGSTAMPLAQMRETGRETS